MTTVTIPRISFKEPALETERVFLAKEASTKLGYNRLALAIAAPDALLYTLRELGIEPFVDSKVQEYMDSKEKKGMYSGTKLVFCLLGTMTTAISLFFAGMANLAGNWSRIHYAFNSAMVIIAILAFVFAACLGFWETGNRKRKVWQTFNLDHAYNGNVPEFAIQRALRINERLPAATFQVHQLAQVVDHMKRANPVVKFLKDPFLSVHLGDESYFIDVWDEEEYEKTL